jgi:hypothetical protein
MAPPIFRLVTSRPAPRGLEPSEPAPSTINEKTIADFTRVVEQTGILNPGATRPEPRDGD